MAPPPSSHSPPAHIPSASLDPIPAEVTPPAPLPFSQSSPIHTPPTELEPIEHAHSTMDLISSVSSTGMNRYVSIYIQYHLNIFKLIFLLLLAYLVGSTSMDGRRKRGCTRGVGLSKINKVLGKKMKINISTKEG